MSLVRKFTILGMILGVSFSVFAAEASEKNSQVWEIKIEPVAAKFPRLEDVHLILTVTNASRESRLLALPYLETQSWYQWIQIYHEGKRLPTGEDEDYVYTPGTVHPGEKLSLLVSLDKFYQAPLGGSQKGRYELLWKGTTIGLAQDTKAGFEVDPKMKTSPDIFSMDPYLKAGKTKEELWKKILSLPSNPQWLALFRVIPKESIEASSLIRLVETTDDLGIKREAIRALGRLGKDPAAESLLIDYLKKQDDKPLIELGVLSLRKLQNK